MQRLNSLARSLGGSNKAAEPEDSKQPPSNQTLFQSFEWYLPGPEDSSADTPSHYTLLTDLLPHLSAIGITHLWLPPGCKATNPQDNGYAIHDLWDLGEFESKGSRRTKWGTREELNEFCAKAQKSQISIMWDAILNHKAGADGKEVAHGVKVDSKGDAPRLLSTRHRPRRRDVDLQRGGLTLATDRTKHISPPRELDTWTAFTFSGRAEKYSDMKYDWRHFSGVDYDARSQDHGIFKFVRKGEQGRGDWAGDVSTELGNYDYLMFADVDHSHPAVRNDIFEWGSWITSSLNLGGMRLDAIKHYSLSFLRDFIAHMDRQHPDQLYIGEYWDAKTEVLEKVIRKFHGRLNLFDVQLVYTFSDYSKGRRVDLRTILNGSLVQKDPTHAVTFVANHDTQEMQSLAAPVEEWFIPLAYSLILLRHNAGTPCVFWGDVFGNHGPRPRFPACGGKLVRLIAARKLYAYGPQRDYFDTVDCIGWTRLGHRLQSNGAGLAVVMTNSWDRRSKRMFVGQRHAGETWKDVLGFEDREVMIDSKGMGTFPVGHRCVGVWINQQAPGFEKLCRFTFPRLAQAVPPITNLPV